MTSPRPSGPARQPVVVELAAAEVVVVAVTLATDDWKSDDVSALAPVDVKKNIEIKQIQLKRVTE